MGISVGMSRGSSPTYEYTRCEPVVKAIKSLNTKPRKGEPDPFNFRVTRMEVARNDKYILVYANYPDCENFHGDKILLIRSSWDDFKKIRKLDPHFLEEGSSSHIIARFQPTMVGWEIGMQLLSNLDD